MISGWLPLSTEDPANPEIFVSQRSQSRSQRRDGQSWRMLSKFRIYNQAALPTSLPNWSHC